MIADAGNVAMCSLKRSHQLDRACMQLGIEPQCIDYVGDPFAYAWSANGQRRDLVQDQRYLIWKTLSEGL